MQELLQRFRAGDHRALAKAITIVTNDDPTKEELLSSLYPLTGRAYIVGLTGPPGVGKSSLIDRLTAQIRREGLTVGIIAVDPTSPFSGGAILGDRIRMQNQTMDRGVYMRSLATRGSLGGLIRNAKEVTSVLDAFGYNIILLETVGVGQSEVDIVKVADTTVVILSPAGGDGIQAIKAGIMEIADIFVINKSDYPETERIFGQINAMLDLRETSGWRCPVIKTNTITGEGVAGFWAAIAAHRAYLENNGLRARQKQESLRENLLEILEHFICRRIKAWVEESGVLDQAVKQVQIGQEDPYTAAGKLLEKVLKDSCLIK